MTDQIYQVSRPQMGRGRIALLRHWPDPWSVGAVLIAALVLMPILSVMWIALTPQQNIWPHLVSTTLPRYMWNTGVLMIGVAALASAVGAGAAWLISVYRFPLSRWLEWLLLLPLAIPAYVGAYALVDFLEYAGPVQTALRNVFGWQSARDYWFPQVRSREAAVIVLAAALYPYVYLLSRAAFREQSGGAYEVARALGAGPFALFRRVGLPLARPAIAAGAAIVMMETVNDFGTVEYFSVQTLTTGIFSVWLQGGNAGGAAQIAMVILVLILVLVALEKISRRNLRFHNLGRAHRPLVPVRLTGLAAWAATLACALPVAVGFVLPVGVMTSHALANTGAWVDPGLLRALANTLTVGGIAAVGTVAAGLFLVYAVRLTGRTLPKLLLPVTTIGYAAPGAVLGVGLLIPMAAADNALADAIEGIFGVDIGLVMTGSAFAIIYAYCVRFFAIAQGAADAAMGRIAPSLPMAARSLGRSARGTLTAVHLPLIRTSVGTALLLVFVDCVKELPATLLLRPFNYNTLATRVYEKASLENLGDAAPAALLVSAVGLVAVGLLARANR
ncbi:iron(III) transport system permease protein [Rhodovulum steppense]|uniref:Iron(III) transport system permease protein n=2 Tax=Rhodovulum steppense TaxID=540251 RepID=A0A4R1YFZ2_9RHOB|nr:iron(III) transport system permease protein [Rhodovulum steppense]